MDFLNAIQVVNAQSSVPYLACFQYYSQEVLKCICTIAISESKTGNLTCFFFIFSSPPPHPQIMFGNIWHDFYIGIYQGRCEESVSSSCVQMFFCICLKPSNGASAYGYCSVCSHLASCYIVWLCILSFVTSDLHV